MREAVLALLALYFVLSVIHFAVRRGYGIKDEHDIEDTAW